MSDRFEELQAFTAVCERRGFAAAARALGRSPPSVTRLVADLEARLGVRLLNRTTRSVGVTEAGARLLERAKALLHDLHEAEAAAAGEQAAPRGILTISAPVLFGRLHVAPIVSRLLAAHPALSVNLELSDRFASLVEEGIDVAVRIGELPDSSLIARRLGQTRRVMVASPDYLARAGSPAHPGELAGHDLIVFRPVTSARQWRFADPQGGGPIEIPIAPRLASSSGDAALDHAMSGGGVVAALGYQVREAIGRGALVEVLAPFAPPPLPIQAVFPSSRLLSAKVRAFLAQASEAAQVWEF